MRLRQRILTVVGALVVLGATVTTGVGYEDSYRDTSSVTILPGPLRAFLTWAPAGDYPDSVGMDGQQGHFTLRVLDERGSVAGWTISVSTVDHAAPGPLALSPGPVSTVRGNPDLSGHATFRVDPVRAIPSLVWSVPRHAGDGEYTLPLIGTPGPTVGQHANAPYTIIVNLNSVAP